MDIENHGLYPSFNTLRVGLRYRLINFGEVFEFEVLEILGDDEALVRSLDTLETFRISELIKFGRGPDFDFVEVK